MINTEEPHTLGNKFVLLKREESIEARNQLSAVL